MSRPRPSLLVSMLRHFAAASVGISVAACVPPAAPCTGTDCAPGLVCDLGACVPLEAPSIGHPGDLEPAEPVEPGLDPPTAAAPGLDDHAVRQLLEIPASDDIGAHLEGLPLLVQLTQPALRAVAFGGDVQHHDGADIGFFELGGARLPSEIERYDGETGALTAWVRVPYVFQGTATRLYMAWGAAQPDARDAIWDDGYHGVWHLSDAPGTDGVIDDATSHGGDGEPANLSDEDALQAVAGRGLRFAHDAAHVAMEVGEPTGWSQDTTVEAWVRIDPGATGTQWIVSSLGVDLGIANEEGDDGPIALFRAGFGVVDCHLPSFLSGTFNLGTGDWHHVAGVIEDRGEHAQVSLFVDGLMCITTEVARPVLDSVVIVGNLPLWEDLDGELDELRIARRALTQEELFAQVANARSPSTFVVAHEPERRDL